MVAAQPCPAVRKPAVDRGGVYRLLPGRRAVLGAVEVRRRARSASSGGNDRGAHRHRVWSQPPAAAFSSTAPSAFAGAALSGTTTSPVSP